MRDAAKFFAGVFGAILYVAAVVFSVAWLGQNGHPLLALITFAAGIAGLLTVVTR